MTTNTNDLADNPLLTDTLVEQRVTSLVGRAISRQLWLMFVDDNDMQVPLLIPISDIPISPEPGDVAHWAEVVRGTVDACGARSVIVVIERFASERLTDSDRLWARLSRDGCSVADVPLRAVLLSHRGGVRLLAPDDYA